MTENEFESRVSRLSDRGIVTKSTSAAIVNAYFDFPEKQKKICENIKKIEKLNDEDFDFFVKLNQLINEIIY